MFNKKKTNFIEPKTLEWEDEDSLAYFNRMYENTFNPEGRVTKSSSLVGDKLKETDPTDLYSTLDALYVNENDFEGYAGDLYRSLENEDLKQKDYFNYPNGTSGANGSTEEAGDGKKKPFYKNISYVSDAISGGITGLSGAVKTYGEWDYALDMHKAKSYLKKAEKSTDEKEKAEYMKKYEDQKAKAENLLNINNETSKKIAEYGNSFSTQDKETGNKVIDKANQVIKNGISSLSSMGAGAGLTGGNVMVGMGVTSYGNAKNEAEEMGIENATQYALINAVIETGSELVLPGSKGLKTLFTTGSLKEALKSAGTESAEDFLREVVKEYGQEAMTELAHIAHEGFYVDGNGEDIGPKTIGEAADRVNTAGLTGAFMGGVTTGTANINNKLNGTYEPKAKNTEFYDTPTNPYPEVPTKIIEKAEPKTIAETMADDINKALGTEAITEEDILNIMAEAPENNTDGNINENSLENTAQNLEGTNTPENIQNAKSQGENAIEEGANTEAQNISENTSPNINRNAPFLSKTIENGKEVYITEEGNTVNAKLAEMVAENQGIPVETLTKFTAEDSAIIENDAKASRIIDNIDTSITENGAEETIKALETDVANGSITEEAYNTAMQYVEARGQLTEGNVNQQELTRSNAETVNNNPNTEMLTKVDNKRQEITKNNTADTTNTEANNVRYDNSPSSNIENTVEAPKKVSKKVREAQSKIDKVTNTNTKSELEKLREYAENISEDVEPIKKIKEAKVDDINDVVELYKKLDATSNPKIQSEIEYKLDSIKDETLKEKAKEKANNEILKEEQEEADRAYREEKQNKIDEVVNTKTFKNVFGKTKLTYTEKLNVEQKTALKLANKLNREVIFYETDSKNAPLGFFKDDTIYINANNKGSSLMSVLGHETFHSLKKTDSKTFNELVDWGVENFSTKEINKFLSKINNETEVERLSNNPKLLSEEMLAESFGTDFANKNFWTNLEKTNKTLFEKVKDFIVKIFKKAENNTNDFLTKKHIKELRAEFESILGKLTDTEAEVKETTSDSKSNQEEASKEIKETSSKTETKDDVKVNNNVTQKLSDFTKTFISEYTDKLGKPKQYDLEEAFRSTLEEYNEKYGLDYKEAESIVNKQLNDAGIPSLDLSYLYDYEGYTERQYLKEQEEARLEAEIEEETKAPEKVLAPKQEAKYNEIKKDLHMLYEVLGDSIVDNDIETQNFIKKDIKNLFKKAKDNKLDMAEINKIEAESKKWSEYISNEKGFKVNDTVYKIEKWKNGYALTNGEFLYEVKNANDVDTKLQELKTDNKVLAPKQKAEPKKKSTKTLSPKYKGKSVLSTMDADYTNRLTRDFEALSKQNNLKFLNDYIPEFKSIAEDVKAELNAIKEGQKGLKFLEKRKFEEAKIKELDDKYGISQKVDEVYNRLANTIPDRTKLENSLNGILETARAKDTSIKKEFTKYLNDIADVYGYEVKNIRETAPKNTVVIGTDKSYNYTAEFFKDGKAITTIETRFMPDLNSISFNSVIYFENKNSTSIDKNKNLFDVSQGIQKNEYIQKSLQNDDVKFSTRKGKEFNEWFEGSVMVKENGKPETFYHTTNAVFDDFNDNAEIKNGRYFGAGHYFTKKIQRRDTYKNSGYDYGKKKYIANLKMTNPMNISEYADLKIAQDIADTITARYGTEASEKVRNSIDNTGGLFWADLLSLIEYDHPKNDFRNILKEYGFDGVYDDYESVYVAFSNDQVNIKTRVDEDGVRFSTRSQTETEKIKTPLLEMAGKVNDLQLRTGIKSIYKMGINKNINLVETFKDAINMLASNEDYAITNQKTLENSLLDKGISPRESYILSKYFSNIVEVAKEKAAPKINPEYIVSTSSNTVSANEVSTNGNSSSTINQVITSTNWKGQKGPIADRIGMGIERAYSRLVDTFHFAKRIAGDDVYRKARLTNTSFGIAENILTNNLTDKNGNVVDSSLKDMLTEVMTEGKELEIMDYVLHKHNIDRATQEKYVFYNEDGTPVSSAQSSEIVAKYEAENPDFKAKAERLTGWINTFMKTWGVDTGILSEELYNVMLNMYPAYVPTNRELNDHLELFGGSYGGKGFVDKSKPVKKLAEGGSARNIIDIRESLVNLVTKTVRTAKMNEVGQSLLQAIRTNSAMEGVASIVDKPEGDNPNVVRVLEKGEAVYVEIHNQDLLNMLEKVHTPEYGDITEVVKTFNNGVKQLITTKNPLFALTNTARDYQTYMVNSSEVSLRKRWSNLQEAIALIQQDIAGNDMTGTKLALYNAMGVNASGIMAKSSHKTVENLTGRKSLINQNTGAIEGYTSISDLKKNWTKIMDGIETLTGSTETAFRLAEFIGAINRGESIEEATLKSMEVTVDFSKGGDITKQADAYVKYLNAGVQGLDNFVRKVGENPARILTRSLVHIGGPALILAAFNSGDDEYEMLDDRTKDNNFLISLKAFGMEGQFIKIPKAREYGMVAMLAERLVYGRGFKNLGRSITENMSPPSPISDNILSDIGKYGDDQAKDFAGRYIVPRALQEYDKKDQWDEDTTVLSKWLGQITGLSPKKLDYYLDSYTGILGDSIMPMFTPSTYTNKEDVLGKSTSFITNKFVADNTRSSSSSSDYYDNLDEMTKIINNEQRDMTTEEKQKYKSETEEVKSYIEDTYGKDIANLNKMLKDKTLTKEEIKEIKKMRNEAMKKANETAKMFLSPKK